MKNLFGLLIAVLFSLTVVSCGGGSTPSSSVKQYFSAMQSGDFAKAFENFNMEEKDKASMVEKLTEMSKDEDYTPFKKFEIIEETISEDGESATVKVSVTMENGGEESEAENNMKLTLVDGKWLIEFR